MQNSEHADAYSSLRVVSCHQKYHRGAQATDASSPLTHSLQPTCSKSGARPREAVFICTKVGLISSSLKLNTGM